MRRVSEGSGASVGCSCGYRGSAHVVLLLGDGRGNIERLRSGSGHRLDGRYVAATETFMLSS